MAINKAKPVSLSTCIKMLSEEDTDVDVAVQVSATAIFTRRRIYLTDLAPESVRRTEQLSELGEYLIVAEPGLWLEVLRDLPRYDGAWFLSVSTVKTEGRCFQTLRRHALDLQPVLTCVESWRDMQSGLDMARAQIDALPGARPEAWQAMLKNNTEELNGYVRCEAGLYLTYARRLQDAVSF